MRQPALYFVMTGAQGLCGGIASTNLNVLQALVDLAQKNAREFVVLSYLEGDADRPAWLPDWVRFWSFQRRKGRFVSHLLYAAARGAVLCFDHVTLALPVLPFAAAGIVKTIIFAHGSECWKRMRLTSRWSLRYASLCLTNSQFTFRQMRQRMPDISLTACPLGLSPTVELNEELPMVGRDHFTFVAADGNMRQLGDKCLLLVARMDEQEGEKGHRALINVLPSLLDEFPDVQLLFPGPGKDRGNLRLLAQAQGVASAVILPGYVDAETLKSLYHHCYAFVMPSTQEGFGLVYLEAMNYAKPCVGCLAQGAEDIIVHDETGFLLRDPYDLDELLGVLQQLLRDLQLARRLGQAGFKRLHDGFTSHHYRQRLTAQVANLL